MDHHLAAEAVRKLTGREIAVSPMYAKVNEWRSWLEGNVKGFHEYKQATDLTGEKPRYQTIRRHTMNMLLKGAEDWASLLLNERTRLVLASEASARWLMGENETGGVFGRTDFWRNANELIATSRWAGTAAFEVYVKRMEVSQASGGGEASLRLASGDDVGINFLCADQILPISHDNGILREAAFVSDRVVGNSILTQLSVHVLAGAEYALMNAVLDESGKFIREPEVILTGSPYPWFSLIRKSGSNIFDPDSPFGVSIISGNEDVLKGLDATFDNFVCDFLLGRKQVFMNSSMFALDADGNRVAPQLAGQTLFIKTGDSLEDGKKYIEEYNPTLRVAENAEAVQKMLDLFSFKIGLGMGRYRFESGTIQTATEYTGKKQDLVQNAAKEMICVEKALTETVRALLWIGGNVLRVPGVDAESEITVLADDGYIIDQESERKRWQEEVAQGLRSKLEYRMHFCGESEEEARAALEQIRAESPLSGELLGM